jgi:hypothetical protein
LILPYIWGGAAGCTNDGGEPKLLLFLGDIFFLPKKIETGKQSVFQFLFSLNLTASQCLFLVLSCTNVNQGIFRGGGRVYLTYLQALKLLANPPLQVFENGARSEFLLTSCNILNQLFTGGQDAHPTIKLSFCGTGILPVQKNSARCLFLPSAVLLRSTVSEHG